MSSSSTTPDESVKLMMDEVTWLQGAFISSLLCGVQITLSIMSFLAVLKQHMRRRRRLVLLVYIFLLCVIMTAGQQISLLFIQTGFIQQRNYPGGPNAFLSSQYSTPVYLASTALFVVGNWMMESLLVWRCKVVCVAGEHPMWIGVIFSLGLLICDYITGALFLHALLQGGYAIDYAIAYLGLSVLLSISVTTMIVGRLLLHRRRTVKQFGRGYGAYYAGVATVLIESASLYTGYLILVIIFFSAGTSTSNVLQQAVAQVETIASMLIIYRIAQGEGWSGDVGVSSVDWRGSPDIEMVREVVHLERASDPTQAGVHVSSKEGGTINPTVSRDNEVS